MSLLKRRSRSETRKVDYAPVLGPREAPLAKVKTTTDWHSSQMQPNKNAFAPPEATANGMERRKTSAELISEAKTLLAEIGPSGPGSDGNRIAMGGVRLVSTRRPITPREPGRALYGKVALAGRPPSAFSMRYLQNESHRVPMTPSLEPIKHREVYGAHSSDYEQQQQQKQTRRRSSRRSLSLDARFELYEVGGAGAQTGSNATAAKAVPRKLPALEIKGVATDVKRASEADSNRERLKTAEPASKSNDASLLDDNGAGQVINVLTSRKLLQPNYHLLAQSPTQQLIELLKEHAGLKDCTDETANHIHSILNELYARVRKNEKYYKRGFILGGLYGLVECSSPKILLAVARVVLALRVTGSNLTGACKLIFKVARNEQNDHLFHDNDLLELLIDGLGRASPLDDPEACIYGYGSIRFLTSSTGQERTADTNTTKDTNKNWAECLELPRKPATAPAPGTDTKNAIEQLQQERFQKLSKQNSLVERLARHGAVELMVLHLQILNEAGAAQKLTGPPLHSLYQLSATLRALADVRQTSYSIERDLDVEEKRQSAQSVQLELACPHLVRAAEVAIGELEVQANIVRTLSVLSEDDNCCHVLVNFTARIGMLLGPCCEIFNNASEKLLSLFSRLGYILGNILAKYDNARVQFYHNDVAMQYLLNVLELYSKEPLTLHNSLGDTVIDVLIKMIRVVANMSVNAEVGIGLGNVSGLGAIMLNLLNAITPMNASQLKADLQELLHATLGALHNLCFYQDKNSTPAQVMTAKGSLQSTLPELAIALYKALKTSRDEATLVEATRVLGNLTRNEKARKYFCRNGGLSLIVQQLTSSLGQVYDLKACAIGVLVNLLGDAENRRPFVQHKGAELLCVLLRHAVQHEDWFLGTIICQAVWNLLIDTPHMSDVCQEQVLDDVCDLLVDYLDEERPYEDGSTVVSDAHWQGFAVVATDLLERIQSNYDRLSDEALSSGGSEHSDRKNSADKTNRSDCDNGKDDDDEDDVYIEEM